MGCDNRNNDTPQIVIPTGGLPPEVANVIQNIIDQYNITQVNLPDLIQQYIDNGLIITGGGSAPSTLIFNLPGTTIVSASGRWEARRSSVNILGAVARLSTAGTTTTTVVLKKNGGSAFLTINLTSGQTRVENDLGSPESVTLETDYITCECTAAGTSAAGLVVEVDLEPV